jgi:hypothetical protein
MSDRRQQRTDANVTFVASLDLGGRFTDSGVIVDALRQAEEFKDAYAGTRFGDRMQLSYRYGAQPEVVAARTELSIRFESWSGTARQLLTVHPAGAITYELELPIDPTAIEVCTAIEDDLDMGMRVRYLPYLHEAFGRQLQQEGADDDDRGIDFIGPTLQLRDLVGDHLMRRPHVYPGIDIRTIVSVLVSDLDTTECDLVAEFVEARKARAQLSTPATIPADVAGAKLEVERSAALVHRWGCLLYTACDTDAALVVADSLEARQIAHDCIAMAQKMWYLARCWSGVLDQMGTLQVRGENLRPEQIHEMERQVLDLSSLEFEVAYSMTTVEATGVMLRDTWHVELFRAALRRFGVADQQRLIERRLQAVARNHDTVTEVLDRFHQHAVRQQADRLQILFAGAVAASVTALLPAIAQVGKAPITVATVVITFLGWLALAVVIWRIGKRQIRLAPAPRRSRLVEYDVEPERQPVERSP